MATPLHDATTFGNSGTGAVDTLTVTHTAGDHDNLIVLVSIVIATTSNETVTDLVINGIPPTGLIESITDGTNEAAYLYYGVEIDAGAFDVTVTTSATTRICMAVTTLYDADQTATYRNQGSTKTSSDTSLTSASASSFSNELVFFVLGKRNTTEDAVVDGNQTKIGQTKTTNATANNNRILEVDFELGVVGTEGWTSAVARSMCSIVVAIKVFGDPEVGEAPTTEHTEGNFRQLKHYSDNSNDTVYTFNNLAPTPKARVLAYVSCYRSSANPEVPTFTGVMDSWTQVATMSSGAGAGTNRRFTLFTAQQDVPGSGTITLTFNNQHLGCAVNVVEIGGRTDLGVSGTSQAQTTTSVSVSLSGHTSGRPIMLGLTLDVRNETIVPENSSWFSFVKAQHNNPDTQVNVLYTLSHDSTPSASWTTTADVQAIAVEVKEPAILQPSIPTTGTGIVSLGPGRQEIPQTILMDSAIAGATVRTGWGRVERTQGSFDWNYIDSQLSKLRDSGKLAHLRISMSSTSVPAWARSGVPFITYQDGSATKTMLAPWNEDLLERKLAFVAALGARFDGHPAVKGVSCQFANARTDDWEIPDGASEVTQWLSLGYTSQKLIDAGKAIITGVAEAFPSTPHLFLSVAQNSGLDTPPGLVSETVVEWAMNTYSGRFLVFRNSFAAPTPNRSVSIQDPTSRWYILAINSPRVGCQPLWYVSGDATYRMNQGNVGNRTSIFRTSMTKMLSYNPTILELYQTDLLDSTLRDEWEHSLMVEQVHDTPGYGVWMHLPDRLEPEEEEQKLESRGKTAATITEVIEPLMPPPIPGVSRANGSPAPPTIREIPNVPKYRRER